MARILTLTMNPALDVVTSAEQVTSGPKIRLRDVRYDPGGGGINVARAIRKLGGEALALFVSGGVAGERLQHLLAAEGVRTIAAPIAEPVRENLKVFERSSGRPFRFVMPGPRLSEEECGEVLRLIEQAMSGAEYLAVSGSMPPDLPGDFLCELAAMAERHRVRFIVDTSGPHLKAALGRKVFLIKPDVAEASELAGRDVHTDADQNEFVRSLIRHGAAEIVTLTLAGEGALLGSRDGLVRIGAPKTDVVSAIGAGDSFLGALILALSRNRPLIDAFLYGIAAGAAAVNTPGTELCRKDDTERFYAELKSAPMVRNDL